MRSAFQKSDCGVPPTPGAGRKRLAPGHPPQFPTNPTRAGWVGNAVEDMVRTRSSVRVGGNRGRFTTSRTRGPHGGSKTSCFGAIEGTRRPPKMARWADWSPAGAPLAIFPRRVRRLRRLPLAAGDPTRCDHGISSSEGTPPSQRDQMRLPVFVSGSSIVRM